MSSVYGIDLLPDNIAAGGVRLLEVVRDAHATRFKTPLPEAAARAVAYIRSKNIVQGHALTLCTSAGLPIVFPECSQRPGHFVIRLLCASARTTQRHQSPPVAMARFNLRVILCPV